MRLVSRRLARFSHQKESGPVQPFKGFNFNNFVAHSHPDLRDLPDTSGPLGHGAVKSCDIHSTQHHAAVASRRP